MIGDESKILEYLELSDLTEPQHIALAEVIGIENFSKLVEFAGGDCYYIPTVTKFKKALMSKYVRNSKKSINAFNRRDLIKKFGVCRKTVDEVLAELRNKK